MYILLMQDALYEQPFLIDPNRIHFLLGRYEIKQVSNYSPDIKKFSNMLAEENYTRILVRPGDFSCPQQEANFLLTEVFTGKAIGYNSICEHQEHSGKHFAKLNGMFIDAAYRGKGLSTLSYSAAIEWAKQNNLKEIYVNYHEKNVASIKAGKKFGFKEEARSVCLWLDAGNNCENALTIHTVRRL